MTIGDYCPDSKANSGVTLLLITSISINSELTSDLREQVEPPTRPMILNRAPLRRYIKINKQGIARERAKSENIQS